MKSLSRHLSLLALSLLVLAGSTVLAASNCIGTDDVCLTSECVQSAGSLLSYLNTEADPCENFYEFACGNFELHHGIPAGDSSFRQSNVVDRLIRGHLRALLEGGSSESSSIPRRKAKLYYKACMDVNRISRNSGSWLRYLVHRLGGLLLHSKYKLSKRWSLNGLLVRRDQFTLNGPFVVSVNHDDKDVLSNVINVEQEGLGLGPSSRDQYLNKTLDDPILAAYTNLLQTYAKLIMGGNRVERKFVEKVVIFEQRLASIHRPLQEQMDVANIYKLVNIKWLQQNAPFIHWLRYLNSLFSSVGVRFTYDAPILLYNAPYFRDLDGLMKYYLKSSGGRKTLQNYFVLRAISMYAPYLGGQFQEARDTFLELFTGQQGSLDRWRTCISDTNANVGFAVGAMYVEKYFSSRDKKQSETVIRDVISAFRDRIKAAPWMDRETRRSALDKVENLSYNVAYPDWLFNETYLTNYYAALRVTDDFVLNQQLAFNFGKEKILRRVTEDPNPLAWLMNPQTINAYYEPTKNKVVIPAGILNRPYYYPTQGVPSALNYGAIGCIAGHEISHGFDTFGKEYDNLGNLKDWWTDETRRQFEARTGCLVKKFNAYRYGKLRVRGEQTLSENIADDGGVKAAYEAFRQARSAGRTGRMRRIAGSDMSEDQLFFVAWAQQWCSIEKHQSIRISMLQGEHSVPIFRVIGPLSNNEEFSKAFNCPVGSTMNPPGKCNIW